VLAVAGLAVGAAMGSAAAGDDTAASTTDAAAQPAPTVTVRMTAPTLPARTATVTVDPADAIQASLDSAAAALDQRQHDLDQRSSDLDAREAAIGAAEATQRNGTIPGDGTFLVGTEVRPGTYRSDAPSSGMCYWARLNGSDEFDIIDNDLSEGQSVVEIRSTDRFFETKGCEEWHLVS
jgi:hypothetical protein